MSDTLPPEGEGDTSPTDPNYPSLYTFYPSQQSGKFRDQLDSHHHVPSQPLPQVPSLEFTDFQIWSQKVDAPENIWTYAHMKTSPSPSASSALAHPVTLDCISDWAVRFPHLADAMASRGSTPNSVLHARVNIGLTDHLNPREWMLQTHMLSKLHHEIAASGTWQSSFKIYSTGGHKVLDLAEDIGEYETSDGTGISLSAPFPVIFWQHFLFGLMESQDPNKDAGMAAYADTPSQIRARKKKEKEAKAVLGGITMVQEISCRSSTTGLQQPPYLILWEFGRAELGKESFTYRKIILPKKLTERQQPAKASVATPSMGHTYMPSPHLPAPAYPSYHVPQQPMPMPAYPQAAYDGQPMMTPVNHYFPVYTSSYPSTLHHPAGSDANGSPEHTSPLPPYSNMMLPMPHGQPQTAPAIHYPGTHMYGSSPYHPQSSPLVARTHQHQVSATRGDVAYAPVEFPGARVVSQQQHHQQLHQPSPMHGANAIHIITENMSDESEDDQGLCDDVGEEASSHVRQPAQGLQIYEDVGDME